MLGAFAADCIPLLFADPVARVIGAAHAGWRGTVGGVAKNVVARMVELGARPDDIRVALGPIIGACCFEVGPEVVAQFREAFGDVPGMVVAGPEEGPHRSTRREPHACSSAPVSRPRTSTTARRARAARPTGSSAIAATAAKVACTWGLLACHRPA